MVELHGLSFPLQCLPALVSAQFAQGTSLHVSLILCRGGNTSHLHVLLHTQRDGDDGPGRESLLKKGSYSLLIRMSPKAEGCHLHYTHKCWKMGNFHQHLTHHRLGVHLGQISHWWLMEQSREKPLSAAPSLPSSTDTSPWLISENTTTFPKFRLCVTPSFVS